MITGKSTDPVTKGEFYLGMITTFTFLFAVHFTADAGEVVRLIILFFILVCLLIWVAAGHRARRRSAEP